MPAPSSSRLDTGPGLRLVAVPRVDGCAVAVLHRPGLGARVALMRDGVALEPDDIRDLVRADHRRKREAGEVVSENIRTPRGHGWDFGESIHQPTDRHSWLID